MTLQDGRRWSRATPGRRGIDARAAGARCITELGKGELRLQVLGAGRRIGSAERLRKSLEVRFREKVRVVVGEEGFVVANFRRGRRPVGLQRLVCHDEPV